MLKKIKLHLFHYRDREKQHIRNLNEDICYILRFGPKEGLLSMFFRAMAFIEYAEKQEYKVYIDMKKYKTMYTCNKEENAWEYFFTQPNRVSEQEAYNNYILSGWKNGGGGMAAI
ncbi:MAG: hypothetical protein ACLRTF_04465 [Blautia sp.]